MKDFDELMDGVLREDGLTDPRTGLKRRVMARVRAEAGHGTVSELRNRWRAWMLVPAAACMGIVVAVWYGGSGSQPDRIASPMSRFSVQWAVRTGIENSPPLVRGNAGLSVGGNGRALREVHLRRDEAAPKMGYPVLERAHYLGRKTSVESASEDEPKLETFPAVSQKGDLAGWLGNGDEEKLAALAREVTPAVAAAYQQLQASQSEPIDIAAIEIKPLQ